MKKIFFYVCLLNLSCKSASQNISDIQKKISSKSYSLSFSINSTVLKAPDKHESEIIHGSIFRNNNYIYSETELALGIYEDTLGLFVHKQFKMADLFNNFSKSTILVNPFYDPAEILSHANTYSSSKKIETKDGDLIIDFSFSSDSIPAKKIRVVENKKDNSFIIEFNYQRLNETVMDVIKYKILSDTVKMNTPKISDYVEIKDGKYVKKPILSKYDFVNSTVLESILKRLQ